MSAASIPSILASNGYVIHSFQWTEPFDHRPVRDSFEAPMISVAKKISERAVQQLLNIGVEDGKIRFYSGNGFTASDRSTFYSTYLQDSDEKKFLLDLSRFIASMDSDPYSGGLLIKEISEF